jgi:ribosomal protein L11 methyltransferase
VANILTNPLCVLAPAIAACVAPGGRLALSGVLAEQAEQVIAAYTPYIALNVGAEHEGWVRLEGSAAC